LTLPSTSYQVQFSLDDRSVAPISHDGLNSSLEFADATCFRRMQPARKVSGSAQNLDLSRDGHLAVVAHTDGSTLWDLAAGMELAVVPAGFCVSAVIQESSDQIEAFSLDKPTRTLVLGRHADASSVAFSPDARWLATGTWKGRGVKVWNVQAQRLERELPVLATASVEFSPDGRWLATGSHPLQVWATGSWHEQWRFEKLESNSPWIWMAFSPDSRLLAVIIRDRDIALLETATGRVLANLEAPDRPRLSRLRFTLDGKLVALEHDGCLQVWDLRRLRAELSGIKLDWDLPAYLQ
jgi:WD40 repeat protein